MPKKGRRRQDHLARRAQTEGYRARSIYKLEALHRKFDLIRRGMRVLDLGAAPGSWTQYVVEQLQHRTGSNDTAGTRGNTSPIVPVVVAVDLQEMSVPGALCIHGDFTDTPVAERIAREAPFDLILSDAAPATTGNRVVDTGRSEALIDSILARLPQWLAPGGSLACKLFQGGGEQAFLREVRTQFTAGHLYRPEAVRRESFETYLVGIRYRGTLGGAITPGEPEAPE